MRMISATEAKNRLGEALAFDENDSLVIQKNNKDLCMVFSASMGKRMILGAYKSGTITRSSAMRLLGLSWYGDLLDLMAEQGIDRPEVEGSERAAMVSNALSLLEKA